MTSRLRIRAGALRRQMRLVAHRATRPLLAGLQARANARWRSHVIETGVDETNVTHRPLLVIAPHPDDETIGCAATIARRRAAGTPVTVVIVSDGGNSHRSSLITEQELAAVRRDESRRAGLLLGVAASQFRFLSFGSDDIRTRQDAIVDALCVAVLDTHPEEILTVSRDDWSDEHRLISDMVLRAVRRTKYPGIVRAFPVWHWDEGPSLAKPSSSPVRQAWDLLQSTRLTHRTPRAVTVRVGELGQTKSRAFACYISQTTSYTGEPDWIPFPPGWIDKFLDYEVFFPVSVQTPSASHD